MPRAHRKPYDAAREWTEGLVREINEGKYKEERIAWLRTANLSDPVGTGLAWARECNAYVCTNGEYFLREGS